MERMLAVESTAGAFQTCICTEVFKLYSSLCDNAICTLIINSLNVTFLVFSLCPVPPKITSEPKNVTANEMDTITFHCTGSGKPEPTITWTRDGQNVGSGEYLNFTAQTNLNGSVYKCTADNGIGQPATATALLTVKALGMR